jgi:hypothetical protein
MESKTKNRKTREQIERMTPFDIYNFSRQDIDDTIQWLKAN